MSFFERLVEVIGSFSKAQLALFGLLGVVTIGGIGMGGYLVYDNYQQKQAIVQAEANKETELWTEATETESESITEMTETETETQTETETETEAGPVAVKLVGSSIERDLKIKIQDEEKKNVKGEDFHISVKADKKNAVESIYNDHDNDGIIYIKDIDGGDYIVALQEIEGYYTEKESIKVTVKAKIEYTKVEVQDEIKNESEVSPSEDAEKEEIEVENTIKDTVELLDSTCVATKVAAATLDKSKYVTSKATLGEVIAKSLPEGVATAFRRSALLVGSSETELISTETITVTETETTVPETQTPTEKPTEAPTETPTEAPTEKPTETEVPTEAPTEKPTETTAPTETDTQTPTESGTNTEEPGTDSSETAKEVTYAFTHKFSDDADGTKTYVQEGKGKVGETIVIAKQEGYKSDYNGTTYTLADGENKLTITWTKVTGTATAKVSMPGTAKMFISKLAIANKITLAVTIEDNNEVKLVDATNIAWSLKDDTAGGMKLSATNGASIDLTTSETTVEGTVTVVATIPYAVDTVKKEATLECKVTVGKDTYDATKLLTDASDRILYSDANCTVKATVADLVEKGIETFYTDPKYTGWQTLDGKLYYFNSKNQPVTGQQIISGITYTFGPDGALTQGATSTGIDVSKWQADIDWNAVKAAGIDFAIIRVGYRGSETGVLVEDPYYRRNIDGATKAGLKVGVYFFTQAITEAEAVEEASMALSLTSGYKLAYPIFIDTENGSGNARANGLDKATRTKCITAFCKTIENAGRKAGVYASKSWYGTKVDVNQFNNYCIWVAQYNTTCTYTGRYSIWQYTSTGRVPGIKGNVDLNISYM